MKEVYDIKNITCNYKLSKGRFCLCRNKIEELFLGNCAVLVVDMQKYFLEKKSHAFVPSSSQVINPILNLVNKAKGNGLFCLQSRHLNNYQNVGNMSVWWNDVIEETEEKSEICDQVAELGLDTLIKTQYDCFYETDLDDILKMNGIEQLVITGLTSHLCVESTARSAFVRGYRVIIPIDGIASYTEEFHKATLNSAKHGFASLTTVQNLIESIGK